MKDIQNKRSDLRDSNRPSKRLLLYFELHDAPRLRAGHPGEDSQDIIDHQATETAIQTSAHDLYEPVNDMLLKAIEANSQTKIALAVSGQMLEQLSKYAPDVIEGLKRLHETGAVEWLGLPYNYSLSVLLSEEVYREEVIRNSDLVYQYFGIRPKVLLAAPFFEKSMVHLAGAMGFEALLVMPGVWTGRSVVRDVTSEIVMIAANETLTTTITQHFGAGNATLTNDDFYNKVNGASDDTVVVGFSYDVFHAHREAGILRFFGKLLAQASKEGRLVHPSEAVHQYAEVLQWPADLEADTSPWLGNEIQREALAASRALAEATKNRLDDKIRKYWLQLLAGDHFLHSQGCGTKRDVRCAPPLGG